MQKACIVVPCYNEEKRLHIEAFKEFLDRTPISLCFVNDGSSDKTIKVLENLRYGFEKQVYIVDLSKNIGKAEAVRSGVNHILQLQTFDLIGYLDADLSTPLGELSSLLDTFNTHPEKVLVMGARVKLLGRNVYRTSKRHYFGRIFSTIASFILKLPVYDTQCGAKIFKAKLAKNIFKDKFITQWLFDVELLARFRNEVGVEKVEDLCAEVPLMYWKEIAGSKIRLSHLIKIPFQLFRIYLKYS